MLCKSFFEAQSLVCMGENNDDSGQLVTKALPVMGEEDPDNTWYGMDSYPIPFSLCPSTQNT